MLRLSTHSLLTVLGLSAAHIRVKIGGGGRGKRSVKGLRGGEEVRLKIERVLLRLVEKVVVRTWMRGGDGA